MPPRRSTKPLQKPLRGGGWLDWFRKHPVSKQYYRTTENTKDIDDEYYVWNNETNVYEWTQSPAKELIKQSAEFIPFFRIHVEAPTAETELNIVRRLYDNPHPECLRILRISDTYYDAELLDIGYTEKKAKDISPKTVFTHLHENLEQLHEQQIVFVVFKDDRFGFSALDNRWKLCSFGQSGITDPSFKAWEREPRLKDGAIADVVEVYTEAIHSSNRRRKLKQKVKDDTYKEALEALKDTPLTDIDNATFSMYLKEQMENTRKKSRSWMYKGAYGTYSFLRFIDTVFFTPAYITFSIIAILARR